MSIDSIFKQVLGMLLISEKYNLKINIAKDIIIIYRGEDTIFTAKDINIAEAFLEGYSFRTKDENN